MRTQTVLQQVERRLERLEIMVAQLLYKETQVMARLQEIVDAVAEEGTVVDSVVKLLEDLTTEIEAQRDNPNPAALDGLLSNIRQQKGRLADAVTKNTPVEGESSGANDKNPPSDFNPSAERKP
jgi:predicted transcriptional regulator